MAIPRLAWVVLALTQTGALGALLGPQVRWWGVDIGSTGATVFGATSWVGRLPETSDSIDDLPAAKLASWLAPLIGANVLVGILIAKTPFKHPYVVRRYAWDQR